MSGAVFREREVSGDGHGSACLMLYASQGKFSCPTTIAGLRCWHMRTKMHCTRVVLDGAEQGHTWPVQAHSWTPEVPVHAWRVNTLLVLLCESLLSQDVSAAMQPKLRAAFSLLHLNALRVTRAAINATFSTLQRRLVSIDPWLPVDTQVSEGGSDCMGRV